MFAKPTDFTRWLDDILSEIDLVSKIGHPGRIIVFGKQALPILTGQNEEDVVMAAAELGKGRIFVFSHDGYGNELKDLNGSYPNSTLYKKVRNWVTRREISNNANILNLDSDQDVANINELKAYDILLSTGANESIPSKKVEDYVKKGGAFIHAATAWSYFQRKEPYELAYMNILLGVGISYSKAISAVPESGFSTKLNKASDANISKYLQEDIGKSINQLGLFTQLKELPVKCRSPFLKYLNNNWKHLNDKIVKAMDTGKIKIDNADQMPLLDFWIFTYELLNKKNCKAFGINHFPGDFEHRPYLTKKTVKFSSTLEDYFFTSCYAPAGTEVNLTVSNVTNNWIIYVGAHMDRLNFYPINRWPKTYVWIEIDKPGTYNILSPFGGSIYFLSPKIGDNNEIEALISNIVICPRFDLVTGGKPWKESRNDPGLWADISGRYMTITLPSSSIRYYDDPTQIMELYDKLLICYHDLRGTQIEKHRKMWIVADIQTFGYMHAGYPIVTHLDVADPANEAFLLNSKAFVTSLFWGIYHEMGHNMQQEEYTFEETIEVTVNIFTLYGMYCIGGIDTWTHPSLVGYFRRERAIDYLKSKPDYEIWKKEAFIALYVYAQLVHEFSWEAYKRVFRRYQALQFNEKPLSTQDKIDMWYLIFSQETKFNLLPLSLLWAIPLSNNGLTAISSLNLKPFLPDDEVTKEAPDRVKLIVATFPSVVRKI